MNNSEIYLDYQSTTPCDPRVVAEMLPYLTAEFGNPSSHHRIGQRARLAIRDGRDQVASLIGALPSEIIFTSGATESNNLAILGVALNAPNSRRTIISLPIEHKSVIGPLGWLSGRDYKVIWCPVLRDGTVDLAALAGLLSHETLLVSIQLANNEIGTVQPIREIAQLTRSVGALLHTDASQALGRISVDVVDLDCDLMSLSAHKMYGPKGIGALFVCSETAEEKVSPVSFGGGQEKALRPGTQNTAGIVGFGAAATIAQRELETERERLSGLRDQIESELLQALPNSWVNGAVSCRLPHATSITSPGISADALCSNLPDVLISHSSACNSSAPEPSHVLKAIGLPSENAYQTFRLSVGRFTSVDDVNRAIDRISRKAKELLGGAFP
jgi:cysteine desulfurase